MIGHRGGFVRDSEGLECLVRQSIVACQLASRLLQRHLFLIETRACYDESGVSGG
jgi:hypothetical protein